VSSPGPDAERRHPRSATAVRSAPRCTLEGPAVVAELLQVEPGTEGGIGAGEDEHVHVVAPVGLAHQALQRANELARQGVARLGPVQRDEGDPLGHLEERDLWHDGWHDGWCAGFGSVSG